MVNTRQKGNRIERKAQDKLEDEGYQVSRMPHTRYGDSDHYNLYDIIACKPDAKIKLIQVKSNSKPNLSAFKEESLEVAPLNHARVEVWTWVDYKGWIIDYLEPISKEWKTIQDET